MMACSFVTLLLGGNVFSIKANGDNSFWHAPDIQSKSSIREFLKLQTEKWTSESRMRNFSLNYILKIWDVYMPNAFLWRMICLFSSLHLLLVAHSQWGHVIATQHLNTSMNKRHQKSILSAIYMSTWPFRKSVSLLRWVRRFDSQCSVINLLNEKLVDKINFLFPNYMKPQI
jgi:hypothetical protein